MNKKGISLVLLIITILVLIIFASIILKIVVGEDSIIQRARIAVLEERALNVEERKNSWKLDNLMDAVLIKHAQTLDDLLNEMRERKLLTSNEITTINETGRVTIGSRIIVFKDLGIADFVQVGDYIEYNPTKLDSDGNVNVDNSKLTYISNKGTATQHGNGSKPQTFQATENIKWRVLDVDSQSKKVELISEDLINTTTGDVFELIGEIGYIYADQELNEICKIFGYGYGADTNLKTTFTIGGPEEEEQKNLIGSGARSINLLDIEKKFGNTGFNDKSIVTLIEPIIYPTVNGVEATGKSVIKATKNIMSCSILTFPFLSSNDTSDNRTNMLLNGDYWVATRYMRASSNFVYFNEMVMIKDGLYKIRDSNLTIGKGKSVVAYGTPKNISCSVRPIVTIKSDVGVEKISTENGINVWKLK